MSTRNEKTCHQNNLLTPDMIQEIIIFTPDLKQRINTNNIYMERIETERLIIIPLSFEQLIKYMRCDNSLEEELGLGSTSRSISDELKEALEKAILPNVADQSKDYLYSTIWTAISKAENKMVGDISMYGEPNEDREVEIGYGTYNEFQNKGYMTETVKGMIGWLKTQRKVKKVCASTEKTNVASYRVLKKNGFINVCKTDNLLKWKLKI